VVSQTFARNPALPLVAVLCKLLTAWNRWRHGTAHGNKPAWSTLRHSDSRHEPQEIPLTSMRGMQFTFVALSLPCWRRSHEFAGPRVPFQEIGIAWKGVSRRASSNPSPV